MTSFDDLRKELAELEEANAKAPHWGAAVGVRHERIKAIQAILNPKVKSKTFIVGYIDFYDNNLLLERIEALDWRIAVTKHSKFPWSEDNADEIAHTVGQSEEDFKQSCSNCDCMMSWIEVTS